MSAMPLLVVLGPPVTKKNSQMIARTAKGTPFIMQSEQSRKWETYAVWQLKTQWKREPIDVPVNMAAMVYREKSVGDALNYLEAVADALERAGVVKNDRLIVAFDGSRMLKDADRPRVEVTLTTMDAA